MTAWIPSAIGAAASLAGSLITNQNNRQLTREVNRKESDLFREANRYNDISAQMRRAMAAGVHPMLMAGAGANPASSASPPSLNTAELVNPFQEFSRAGQSITSALLTEDQMALTAEQIEVQKEQLTLKQVENTVNLLNSASSLLGRELTFDEVKSIIRSANPQFAEFGEGIDSVYRDSYLMENIRNSSEFQRLSTEEKQKVVSILSDVQEAELENIKADTELKRESTTYRRESTENVRADTLLKKHQAALAEVNTRLGEERVREVRQAVANMEEQYKSLFAQGQMDLKKLAKYSDILKAEYDKLLHELNISAKEDTYWVWQSLITAPWATRLIADAKTSSKKFSIDVPYYNP